MAQQKKVKGGSRKHGRSKRKNSNSPIALYVKNKISFETYAKQTGVKRVK